MQSSNVKILVPNDQVCTRVVINGIIADKAGESSSAGNDYHIEYWFLNADLPVYELSYRLERKPVTFHGLKIHTIL